jgi:hypothetical protein
VKIKGVPLLHYIYKRSSTTGLGGSAGVCVFNRYLSIQAYFR